MENNQEFSNSNNSLDDKKENMNSSKSQMFTNNNSNTIIIVLVILLVLALLGVNFFLMVGGVLQTLFDGLKYYILNLLSLLGFYSGAIINTSADIVGDTAKETVDIAEGTVQSIGNLLQNRDNMGDESLDQQQWNMNVFSMNPTPMPDSGYDSDLNSMQQQINKINKKINNEDMEAINNVKPAIESSADKINNFNEKIKNFANEVNSKQSALQQLNQEINEKRKVLSSIPEESPSESNMSWCPVGYDKGSGLCTQIAKGDKCMYGKVFTSKTECEEDVLKPSFSGYMSNNKSINWGTPPPPPPMGALTPPIHKKSCAPLPGMCINQKPMCGPQKCMPMQSQTIPSRGQIQGNMKTNAQQQQQQQQEQPSSLPTFPFQTNPFENQNNSSNSPDSQNNQNNNYEPMPSSNNNNTVTVSPGTSNSITSSPQGPVQLVPSPGGNTSSSVVSPPSSVPAPMTSSEQPSQLNPGQHHHHSHHHDGDNHSNNVLPSGSNGSVNKSTCEMKVNGICDGDDSKSNSDWFSDYNNGGPKPSSLLECDKRLVAWKQKCIAEGNNSTEVFMKYKNNEETVIQPLVVQPFGTEYKPVTNKELVPSPVESVQTNGSNTGLISGNGSTGMEGTSDGLEKSLQQLTKAVDENTEARNVVTTPA